MGTGALVIALLLHKFNITNIYIDMYNSIIYTSMYIYVYIYVCNIEFM